MTQVRDLKTQFEEMSQKGSGFLKTSIGPDGKKSYGPPKIPQTPSRTINNMLAQRCGKAYDNPVKAGIAIYICGVFTVITKLYSMINPDKTKESHTMWMVACGVVTVVLILQSYLVYNIVIASAFVLHTLLYYSAILLALFGTGLAVSGAVFFDKDGGNQKTFTAGVGNYKASTTINTDFSKSQ